MPQDGFAREIDYLRISLTDRCNLRCTYCMPIEQPVLAPDAEVLTADEIALVARAAVKVGFRKFRLTGGEPTLRSDLLEIVSRIARTEGVKDLSLTTNGVLLDRLAAPLREAGLRRVNVHVDTLDREKLPRIMRWGSFEQIWRGIEAAEAAGLAPIKLNVVVVAGENDADVVDLARLTLERPWHVRFIELMPLGPGECSRVARRCYVPNTIVRSRIEQALGALERVPGHRSDESRNHRLPGAKGIVGFISPVSEPYCGTCNRMRLTSDGKFHLCLLNDDELDVKAAIRSGRGEDAVAEILLRAVREKPTGHHLDEGISTRSRRMHALGG
jgi:cyclic pyranopterin phosphate synthase